MECLSFYAKREGLPKQMIDAFFASLQEAAVTSAVADGGVSELLNEIELCLHL